jgi:CRP-like cAMP-binding protein/HAMP domain-containing protein
MPALSIRQTVPLMILVPLLTYVGLTGWLAILNGRRTVNDLSTLNSRTLNQQIKDRLKDYLETPALLNQFNADAIHLGEIDLQKPDSLSRQFLAEIRLLDKVDGIEFGFASTGAVRSVMRLENQSFALAVADASTQFVKVYHAIDKGGGRIQRIRPYDNRKYDARQRPWYQKAIAAGKLSWTKPFPKFSNKKQKPIQISLVQPVYAKGSGQLLGVLAVQFLQANISKFLQTLKVGKSGQTFIVNRSGELIATSTNQPLFKENGAEILPIAAIDAQNVLIQATAQQVQTQYKAFSQIPDDTLLQFKFQNTLQLAQVAHYNNTFGLDWRVITVIPQKDFTQGLEATAHQSFLLGLSALAVSVVLGLLATRWLVRPVLALSTAAKQIGKSEFDPSSLTPLTQRTDEIGQLVRVFQEMFQVVHDREQSLHTRVQELTDEADRLKKLETANRTSGTANLRDLLQRSQHLRMQASQQSMQLPDLLRSLSFFSLSSDAELQTLMALGHEQRLATREVVCHENEQEDCFYILLAGRVEVYLEKFNLSLSTLGAGSFFGEISLMLATPRTATVRTLDPSILFVTDQKGFRMLYQKYPELALQIDRKVQERQIALEKSKTELQAMNLPGDESALAQNFLLWSRKQMKTLLGM